MKTARAKQPPKPAQPRDDAPEPTTENTDHPSLDERRTKGVRGQGKAPDSDAPVRDDETHLRDGDGLPVSAPKK